MPSLDLLRRHLVVTAAVAGLLLGGVIGLFLPIRAASFPKTSSEAWVLPALGDTKRFRTDAYTALRAARFWKTVAGPGQQGVPKVEWTLTGIITRPRLMAAVDRPGAVRGEKTGDSTPSALVAIGAELPDGSTLVRLTRDAVWFEKDGCLRERRLYRPVTAENNACIGEAEPGTDDSMDPSDASTPMTSTAKPSTSDTSIPKTQAPAAATPQSGSDRARSAPSAEPAPPTAGAATP